MVAQVLIYIDMETIVLKNMDYMVQVAKAHRSSPFDTSTSNLITSTVD